MRKEVVGHVAETKVLVGHTFLIAGITKNFPDIGKKEVRNVI